MGNPPADAEYPINAVSKLTGVSCHALRIWERRYGFPQPNRSASGHRRYGIDQVRTLRRISELTRAGRSIGDLIADVKSGRIILDPIHEDGVVTPAEAAGHGVLAEFMDRMIAGDVAGAVEVFERLESTLPLDQLIDHVIASALTETGERWFRRRCSVYQERCVSVFLRRKLAGLVEAAHRANAAPAHSVLVGTVQGDRHEGGVLLAHLSLERAGWRVTNLGVDLPVSEYVRAVQHLRPDALALSFVLSRNINKRFEELSRLRELPVFVGGRSILNYQRLARRYGLIPLVGPVGQAVEQLVRQYGEWRAVAGRTAHGG